MRLTTLFLFFALVSFASFAQKTSFSVLVYTKNGPGYVHDNIPSAVAAVQKLGTENHFKVDVSADPVVFEEQNLAK
ncbi:MAG: ThuA domain-containing protein, partial [Aquirufa sp.]